MLCDPPVCSTVSGWGAALVGCPWFPLVLRVSGCIPTNGVAPVIKHIPGHGRAKIDSHLDLPIIETSVSELDETDFYPFKKNNADLAMAAHIVYKDIDNSQPGTLSKKVINDIIRKKVTHLLHHPSSSSLGCWH